MELRRLDNLYRYDYDYADRLIRAYEQTTPTEASFNWTAADWNNPANWPFHEEIRYDVLGNVIGRQWGSNANERVHVPENGKTLLELTGTGRLQRHRLYAGVDQLLAVENFGTIPTADTVILDPG